MYFWPVPKIIKINRICEQPSKEVSLFGPTCTCTNTTALLLIPDILSLHNRKLSLHILCITAQYFMPCQRSFAVKGPRTWSSLPADLRTPDTTLCSFKRHLKAHLLRLHCYLFLIFLSLHKQPFITAQSPVITAYFVYHCTVFYVMLDTHLLSCFHH